MANRLEQEFPRIRWQATAPLGPGGASPEIVQQYIERGRHLRSRALRQSARAVVRAPRLSIAFFRRMIAGAAARVPAHDRWSSPAHGA